MATKRLMAGVALVLTLAMTAAGCGDDSDDDNAGGTFTPPELTAAATLPPAEGTLNVLAWPGYAEDGSTDPDVDWVTPFEEATGCQVNVKTFGTSDEAFELFKSGQYDVVSASGDASLRLVAGGDVEPVNVDLVPNYVDVIPELKDQAWNTVNGVHYGVPHGRGANLLMYRNDIVDPAPTAWAEVFQADSPYKGKVTAYGGPIYIADAALVLMDTRPELGITNPYALDEDQFQAALELLRTQRSLVSEYWTDAAKEIDAFKGGDPSSVIGTSWQYQVNTIGDQVGGIVPKEGSTGWSDTWMISANSDAKGCAYRWLDHIVSPETNDQVAQWFGEAPANAKSCDLSKASKENCETFHAEDTPYWERVFYWTTPIAQCLDGRTDVTCVDYSRWQEEFAKIKG